MTPADPVAGDHERGFVTVQYVAVVGLSLVLFTLLANLVVFQYGRGLARAAVDEGARVGSRVTGTVDACEARVEAAIRPLAGRSWTAGVVAICDDTGERVRARVMATMRGWMPLMPDLRIDATGVAVKERAP